MKMKRIDRMIERHRMWETLRRARGTIGPSAAGCWQIDGEELSRLYRQAEAMPPTALRVQRSAKLRVVAMSLAVAVPLSLSASLGISCVHPATDGYTMNVGADRTDAVVKIDNMIHNT